MNTARAPFLFYCLALVVLAVCAAEFWLLPKQQGLPRESLLNGFVAVPGTDIDGQRINALGFTGGVPSKEKQPDSLRVLLLGSSTLFNRHLGERLQQALQQRTTRRVEVLDAGLRSHTSRADLLKWDLLADYQWDVVVVYNGINDLWANHVQAADFYADYRHLDPWYRRTPWLDNSLLLRQAYNGGWHLLHALNRASGARLFPDYQFVFPKKPYVNAAAFASLNSYRDNVGTLLERVRAQGAKPVLLTFAWHIPASYSRQAFIDHALDYQNPERYDERDVFNWGPPDYVREALSRQNDIVRILGAQQDVLLLDIDAEMSHHGEWFGDVCHFSEAGVDVFTARLSSALLP
jgi:hypothetical protein